jgi:hypothetical protein
MGANEFCERVAAAVPRGCSVLVIGFYDRMNAGDESYKAVFAGLFRNAAALEFVCVDDCDGIPASVDLVVVGGGDVVNGYFMRRVQKFKEAHVASGGRAVFAGLSLGVPYESESHFFDLFDFVCTRSRRCTELAVARLGPERVLYAPDLVLALAFDRCRESHGPKRRRIMGVCLAQPAFAGVSGAPEFLGRALAGAAVARGCEALHLIAFNTTPANANESDVALSTDVAAYVRREYEGLRVHVLLPNSSSNCPAASTAGAAAYWRNIANRVAECDFVVAMRYHALVYSLLCRVPCVPMYTTPKMQRLASDMLLPPCARVQLDTRPNGRARVGDAEALGCRLAAAAAAVQAHAVDYDGIGAELSRASAALAAHLARALARNPRASPTRLPGEGLIEFSMRLAQRLLAAYYGACVTDADVAELLNGDVALWGVVHRCLPAIDDARWRELSLDVARLLTSTLTDLDMSSPFLWGLHEKLRNGRCLALREELEYVERAHARARGSAKEDPEGQAPGSARADGDWALDLDYIAPQDYSSYHRSGWAHATAGLAALGRRRATGDQRKVIIVDTYVDRTFHWGLHTLHLLGKVPYTAPWCGFVHHTFDESHSSYNCAELFRCAQFLESLTWCVGLLVMARDLAAKMRAALARAGFARVPVFAVVHPTETPELRFSMERLVANRERLLVSVGAWMRNPYTIYGLQLPHQNEVGLAKAALKGKEMDLYFPPAGLLARLQACVSQHSPHECASPAASTNDQICGSVQWLCRLVARHLAKRPRVLMRLKRNKKDEKISRPERHPMCRGCNVNNKFVQGMLGSVSDNVKSVKVIERLSNDDYDELLSANVVFLDLVDAAAVNTVVECVVRNTPILVNRLPALEEVLGPAYPGFYTSPSHAASMLTYQNVERLHRYIERLDKAPFRVERFIDDVAACIGAMFSKGRASGII